MSKRAPQRDVDILDATLGPEQLLVLYDGT